MEEQNPWLDPESVKHINKKSVKPEPKIVESSIKIVVESSTKIINSPSTKIVDSPSNKIVNSTREISERDRIDLEKVPHGLISVSNIVKTDEKITKFLETLTSKFSTNLPETSKKWAIENFGEDWLRVFLKDVEYLQSDLKTSKFFPSQDKMIFLKYIFLLQQSL
jgi:hypothetical protein